MISLLLTLLFILIVLVIVFYILSQIPLPQPWLNIVRAIIALIALILILDLIIPGGTFHRFTL
jgi:hypothetical protein